MIWARQVDGRPGSQAPYELAQLAEPEQPNGDRPHGGRRGRFAARRWRWAAAVLVVGVVLAGCEAPRPDVTFFGNRSAVQTAPTHWCDVDETASTVSCTETAVEDVPRLSLRPGQQVQINVPGAVGSTPWTVYFRYLDAKGELADGRSEVFSDGRLAYTLQPLTPQDQLTYVEVQSAFVLVPGDQGGVDFAATRAWLLLVDPLPAAGAPQQ